MPEKIIGGGYTLADAEKWAASLTAAIKTGAYKSEAAGWLTSIELSDPVSSSMVWAEQANAYVCTTVMPDGVTAVRGMELDGAYYQSAAPVIQLQIARAGYRYVCVCSSMTIGKD